MICEDPYEAIKKRWAAIRATEAREAYAAMLPNARARFNARKERRLEIEVWGQAFTPMPPYDPEEGEDRRR